MPHLDDLQIIDYTEMLEMSNNNRHRYYEYLYGKRAADSQDEVLRKKSVHTKPSRCISIEILSIR